MTYSRPVYGVTLKHPPGWRPVPGYGDSSERHGGEDGFFQLGAAVVVGPGAPPPSTLDDVAREEASHKLKPYGSRPTSERLRVAGREPRLR